MPKPHIYTQEEIIFIKANYKNSYEQLRRIFNETYNLNINKKSFMYYCKKLGLTCNYFYDEEKIEFLKNQYQLYKNDFSIIAQNYNLKFGDTKKIDAIRKILVKSKVHKPKFMGEKLVYTDEMINWIKSNCDSYNTEKVYEYNNLIKDFYNKFKIELSHKKITNIFHKIGYKMNNQHLALSVDLAKLSLERAKKIGEEIINDGIVYVKVSDEKIKKGEFRRKNYIRKTRYMYEKYHNCILKDDEYILQIDNDPFNFDINNLIKIDTSSFGKYKGYKYCNMNDIRLKKIAITLCELECLVEE